MYTLCVQIMYIYMICIYIYIYVHTHYIYIYIHVWQTGVSRRGGWKNGPERQGKTIVEVGWWVASSETSSQRWAQTENSCSLRPAARRLAKCGALEKARAGKRQGKPIYIYIYRDTCVYTYYIYIYIYIYNMYIHMCLCICVHVYIYIYIYA